MQPSAPLPKSRIEALTDGIFAVTMTLLVLDLRLPESPSDASSLLDGMLALVPRVDDYVISFLVLGVFRTTHMSLMRLLRGVDRSFVWVNLALLLLTALVPPLTAFVDHNTSRPEAAFVYGANLLAIVLVEATMWRRGVLRLSDLRGEEAVTVWHIARRRSLAAAVVCLAGIAVALLELTLRTEIVVAPYVYLLVLVAGMLRSEIRHPPGDGRAPAP